MNFIEFCKHQHDVECNQKYNKILPYSFHLNLVAEQAKKWKSFGKTRRYVRDFSLLFFKR